MKSPMKSGRLRILMILAVVTTICVAAVAENIEEYSQRKEVLTPLEQQMLKKISIDFRNTPIEDVIRIMAEQANVDIIKSPDVTGNVTTTLTDVPLEEALNSILAAHGYGYVLTKNMIRIAPMAQITEMAERLVSRIYRINYADVKGVEEALKKFISQKGSLSANIGTSNIIVTDTETKIKAIDTFIEEIDRITPQILVEARVYDITSREKLDLGIEWETGRNTTFTSSTLGVNPSGEKLTPFMKGNFDGATDKTATSTSAFLRWGILGGGLDIDMQLRAEHEKADAKLLANPRILVLDNETALFDIVTEIPYSEATFTGSTAVTETIKFKNVGVKLEVTPHLTRDGMIRLKITPEFSVVVREESFSTSDVPVVDTRKVNTITLVKDGQTVVLGGLRKKDVSQQVNKVPLLGDLPLIGALFRFEGEDTAITELVVFITPRIIEQPITMSQTEQHALEVTNFSGPKVNLTRAEKPKETDKPQKQDK